ncbi:MAG: hypothetical protein A3F10_00445 [Coxiella sp. RIFCSPHIGHO2_12_FULL_42_15]|nr:MAG: hypothetical protein A3F10_00445 [Coxiella sp. RIFCSPHIGHO2_12_FULL_42_15]
MVNTERVQSILEFWFGRVEETVIPSENRARIWFGDNKQVDSEIKSRFDKDLESAVRGDYLHWEKNSRSQLALIITLDQFSRHIHRGKSYAYAQDDYALSICTRGMEHELDHYLSLIERVFYYFPLLHSEHLAYQESSIRAYEILVELALPETKVIYESFFKFANHHYSIVRRFGRFPQRNAVLGRGSTKEELDYLKESEQY